MSGIDCIISCSCCGKGIHNTEEENTAFGEVPYPYDIGFGMCRDCGGDNTATGEDDESFKKRLGWAGRTFFEARFDTIRKSLKSPEKREHWDRLSYRKKVAFITKAVEKGWLT